MRRHQFAGAVLAVAVLVSACSGSSSGRSIPTTAASSPSTTAGTALAAPALPSTPAGTQAQWVLAVHAALPLSAATAAAHFDRTVLGEVSLTQLNAALSTLGAIRPVEVTASQDDALDITVSSPSTHGNLDMKLGVDAQGLISTLRFTPLTQLPAVPTTWAGVDSQLASVAPHVRLLVAELTAGRCAALHSLDPATPAPLGSGFKLYLLSALAAATNAGKVSWNQDLVVTSATRSLPSGTLQDQPDGTRISVLDTAVKMISISDNTGANMIASLLGRPAVEQALVATHMADPALDTPFLTTREFFALKLDDYPALIGRYAAAGPAARTSMLAAVDAAPLPSTAQEATWTTPRQIDSVEWFASAEDICNAYAYLDSQAGPPGSPLNRILEVNDGGLGLAPSLWSRTWFKGGSEPGVLTLSYLATNSSGHTYVVVALAENPVNAIDDTIAAPVMLSAIKGAFTLAAAS